jgi:hypothetical protein
VIDREDAMTVRGRTDRKPWGRLIKWIEPEENPAATIYGTIAVGLVIAAEDPTKETYPRVVLATTVTVGVYWLAHGYADWLSRRLRDGSAPSAAQYGLGHALRDQWPLVEGAMVPVIALLLAWVAGVDLSTGVAAALWTAAACLLAFEFVAGMRRRLSAAHMLGNAVVGAALGGALLAVKLLLH